MAFLDRFHPSKHHTAELDHVVANISAVLNTKQGFGSLVRQLGIGEYFGRPGAKDAMATLKAEIEGEIAKFETRLTEVEILLLGRTNDLQLSYELHGKVAGKRCKLSILFNTSYGNFTVEKVAP